MAENKAQISNISSTLLEADKKNYGLGVSLNRDVLTHIFKFMDVRSKCNAAQVCKLWQEVGDAKSAWRNVVATLNKQNCHPATYRTLVARGINRFHVIGFDPALCEILQSLNNIEDIHFENDCIGYFQLNLFQNLPNLRTLNMSNCPVNDDCLKIISLYLPSLEELGLFEVTCITNNGLLMLSSGLRNLHRLNLNGSFRRPLTSITDDGINYLTGYDRDELGIISLRHLNLKYIWRLTDDSLKYIGLKLVNLVSLGLCTNGRISDIGLGHLIGLKQLECLYLARCSIVTDNGLEVLTQLPNLIHLNLNHCELITDIGLKHISQLKNLKQLDLTNCNLITDTGLKSISELKNLTDLGLSHCNLITYDGFKLISLLVNLKYLDLSYCVKITHNGLEELTAPTSLRTLKFSGCPISNTDLKNITSGIPKLAELDISYCHFIGDEGLKHISQSSFKSALLHLCIDGCHNIGDTGISYIVKGCPNIRKISAKFCSNITMSWQVLVNHTRQVET